MKQKKVIVISHGNLAAGMQHSVQMIMGANEDLTSMGMLPGEHYQPMVDFIEQQLKENPDTQYIVIADMFGGSVCNGMTSLTGYSNLKLIAGMNLGLVIQILLAEGQLTDEEIERCIAEAKEMNRSVVLEPINEEGGEDDFY